jgi:hypothetical protein
MSQALSLPFAHYEHFFASHQDKAPPYRQKSLNGAALNRVYLVVC